MNDERSIGYVYSRILLEICKAYECLKSVAYDQHSTKMSKSIKFNNKFKFNGTYHFQSYLCLLLKITLYYEIYIPITNQSIDNLNDENSVIDVLNILINSCTILRKIYLI